MPGKVIRVARRGRATRSRRAQPLVVLEAMKMEMPLLAPRAGRVAAVHAAEGDTVARGRCSSS